MKILFAFENALPSHEADAEGFVTTAAHVAGLVPCSWLHVPLPADADRQAIGMLAGITLTALIVVLFWPWPVAVLLSLTLFYLLAAICLYRRLSGLLQDWQTLAASLDQLRKDRECLEKILT